MGYEAYQQTIAHVRKPVRIKEEAFLKASHLLYRLYQSPDDRFLQRITIRYVTTLWNIVKRDLRSNNRGMSDKLAADLTSMMIFVEREVVEISHRPNKAGVMSLVNIHRNLSHAFSQ